MNATGKNARSSRPLIMVVDDNPEFLNGIELTLEMEGYRVWTALSGQDALDRLKAAFLEDNRETAALDRLPNLMLVDIMMPGMDGYALYEEMRANPFLNHIPLIFLTAKSSDEDIRYGKELGADDYLTKLASTDDMLASIRGKLKRAEQQKSLATQFSGGAGQFPEGARILVIALGVALLIIGCLLGVLLASNWLG